MRLSIKSEPQETHRVVTVEDDDHEPTEMFRGSRRKCQSFINKEGLITLEIKIISDNPLLFK
jgi:hypothetical protein